MSRRLAFLGACIIAPCLFASSSGWSKPRESVHETLHPPEAETDGPVFSSSLLPHDITYPAFTQEELIFVPSRSDDKILDLRELNLRPVVTFTPHIHTFLLPDGYHLHTELHGRTNVFFDNKFVLNASLSHDMKVIRYEIHIESHGSQFRFEGNTVRTREVHGNLYDGISYVSMNTDSLNDVGSQYRYDMEQRDEMETGFEHVTYRRRKTGYTGHYDLMVRTPYDRSAQGFFLLHLSLDNPLLHDRPQ